MARQDLKQIDNDITIESGDFVITLSDSTHVADTVNANKGFWKAWPLDGVQVIRFIGDASSDQELIREIIVELKKDGYKCEQPFVQRDYKGNATIYPNALLNDE